MMKHMRKLISLFLALAMAMSLSVTAFAQEVGTAAAGTGTITVSNAAKGETYAVYKLFDASVTGTENGSIAYTGNIPNSLADYFTKDSAGNITATAAAKDGDNMSEGLKTALAAWVTGTSAAVSAKSDGSVLHFYGLDYGYYVITTTQGEQAITVDSTNPNVTIVDKNSSTPTDLKKVADDEDVNIGDTVTYTVFFKTANYDGAGTEAKQITSYIIQDTLPGFLSNVTVTGIVVDDDGDTGTTNDQTELTVQQFINKQITIDWVDENSASLYQNGAYLVITYTATVTDDAAIDGNGNTNEVTIQWTTDSDTPEDGKLTTDETIYTYAIALKKVDENGNALAGAEFQFPFYVKVTPDADGAYLYAGTAPGNGLTDVIVTPNSGEIVVKGVASGEYAITETKAPLGYNQLTEPVTVNAVKTGATSTSKTFYIDESGNVTETATETKVTYTNTNIAATVVLVINMTGSELPSTGGMGTTMFYVFGIILTLLAAVLLITKKRMRSAE